MHILETQDLPANAKLPTLESLITSRRERLAAAPATPTLDAGTPPLPDSRDSQLVSTTVPSSSPSLSASPSPSPPTSAAPLTSDTQSSASTAEFEEEAEAEGAFNPETGEINWDCPCLGGMAHGTCGQEFRDAFSCFVYSEKEPKGVDCIDKFKTMQDCFRAHPDEYGSELTGDDDDEGLEGEMGAVGEGRATAPYSGEEAPADQVSGANLTSAPAASLAGVSGATGISAEATSKDEEAERTRQRATAATKQVANDHSGAVEEGEAVPKAWHDTREKNHGS